MGLIKRLGALLVRNGFLATSGDCCCECPPGQQCGVHCCTTNELCCSGGEINNCCPDEIGWGCCAGECCPPGSNCVNGQCVPICPEERYCGDVCCPEGEICVDGTCLEPCEYEGCPECWFPDTVEEYLPSTEVCDGSPQIVSYRVRVNGGGKLGGGPYCAGGLGCIYPSWQGWPWRTDNGYPERLEPESCDFRWYLDIFYEVCQGTLPDDPTVWCAYKTHYRWRLFQPRKTGGVCELVDITEEAIDDPTPGFLSGSFCNSDPSGYWDPVCGEGCEGFSPEGPEPLRYLEDPVMECDP